MKKINYFLLSALILSILFAFISCDSSVEVTYPAWFDEYSGITLNTLKAMQDNYQCFGDTIGSNVIIKYYSLWEDSVEIDLNMTFGPRDNGDLVDSTDIQPFKDAVLESEFMYDETSSDPSLGSYTYVKGDVSINIYIVAMTGDEAHFEIVIHEVF
jgi:hypothetical protein